MNDFRFALAAAVCAAAALSGCKPEMALAKKGPAYRTAPITKTDIVRTVEATGKVTPRNSSKGIPVGAQVNGKLIKLFADYNSVVTNGQVVALIDPLVYEANYKSALAQLHVNEANVDVRKAALRAAQAELVLAQKTHERKASLVEKKVASVADLDSAVEALDKARSAVAQAEANLESAAAAVEQSRATCDKAKTDLGYCTIVSPVDGVVIARKVEEGETVVSSMNAVPILTIAEDLKTIWVEADIPEADIGNISVGQEVTFTADAYRTRFRGKVKQVRKASTETNNVVTFPVIIEADNPNEKLFPGMTATLSIETARAEDVTAVSVSAIRFRPKDEDLARVKGEVERGRKIWLAPLKDGDPIEYVKITEGVSDDSFTELVGIDEARVRGREAIVGYATAATAAAKGSSNPFMPKPPQHGKNKGTAPEPKK